MSDKELPFATESTGWNSRHAKSEGGNSSCYSHPSTISTEFQPSKNFKSQQPTPKAGKKNLWKKKI
jgi:hypothetical protein